MTRFENDLKTAQQDPWEGIAILTDRKEKLQELWRKGKAEKNAWKAECIAQEYMRLHSEYDAIAAAIG